MKEVVRAFPYFAGAFAEQAACALAPFVDDSYRKSSTEAVVLGRTVDIPNRIHFLPLDDEALRLHDGALIAIRCLRTRSTDGYVRHAALRYLLGVSEPWVMPFIALLAGEYVVEIVEDMVAALPKLDRGVWRNFVLENRSLMRRQRMRAVSYWNCYYRQDYPDRSSYPGLVFLHEVERWAA